MFGKIVKLVVLFAVCSFALSANVWAADTIGLESLVETPGHAAYLQVTPDRPSDGQTVYRDPPRFTWTREADPSTMEYNDTPLRQYRFQVASDAGFTTLLVNVVTDSNGYNMLAPFNISQAWWRVGYLVPGDPGTVEQWSATRTFYIDPGHIDWDRSYLADETYLTSKAQHPRVIFNPTNIPLIRAWIATDSRAMSQLNEVKDFANDALAATSWGSATGSNFEWKGLRSVALAWMLTGDAKYLDSGMTAQMLVDLSNLFLAANLDSKDDYDGHNIRAMAMAFDWLYHEMTQAQRDQVINAMDLRAFHIINRFGFRNDEGTNVGNSSLWRVGDGHMFDNFNLTMYTAMAAWEHSANLRELFDKGMNYHLGMTCWAGSESGQNQGFGYGTYHHVDILNYVFIANTIFPEVEFDKNPYLDTADFFGRMVPVGLPFTNWGDGRWRLDGANNSISSWAEMHSYIRNDGVTYNHFLNENGGGVVERWNNEFMYVDIPLRWYYSAPTPVAETTKGAVYPLEGWATAAASAPSEPAAVANGVGFSFRSSPRVNVTTHSGFYDLSFQAYAYGEMLNYPGHDRQTNLNMQHNSISHNTLLIDGLGQNQAFGYTYQWHEYVARIVAFDEADDYIYVCGDATNSYPHNTFPSGKKGVIAIFRSQDASHLERMRRHMLLMRGKYIVIFDEARASKPSTFTWLYSIEDETWTWSDTSKADFMYEQGNVDIYLKHIGNNAALDINTWIEDEALHINPITGEEWADGGSTDPGTYRKSPKRRLWISNSQPTQAHTFLSVLYPVDNGGPAPTINRINDKTVEVIYGSDHDVITFDAAYEAIATLVIDIGKVKGRQIFYNNSAWDGNDTAANAADDGAIATDKQPLLNGQIASFANYTSYSKGINGIMVDIADLPTTPTAADFQFKAGSNSIPSGWAAAPDPTSITVRTGAGAMGSDRVTILWADGAITNRWLEVTVKATSNTGLEDDDVFYFGNAIGETGNSASDAQVTPTDEVEVRNNPASLAINPAAVTHSCDFNRDKKVGPTDMILCRNNGTNSSTALPLIVLIPNTAPTVLAGSDATITLPTDTVSLDGTVTDDGYPDPPATVTTTWSKVSGPGTVTFVNDAAVDTDATFTVPGDYVLQLEADDTDLTSSDQVAITVNPDPSFNYAPAVDAGADKAITLPTNSVSIDATVTDDGNPNPPSTVTYAWTQISGTAGVVFGTPTAVDTTATFPAADIYVLRLTANDSELAAYDDVTVTVSNPPSMGAFQESGGMVVMEAENFSNNDTNSSSTNWFEDTAFTGYAGPGYMQAIGGSNQTWDTGAELGFDIDFETVGTYSIWLRVNINSVSSRFVAIGMDDARIGNSLSYTDSYLTWDWIKHTSDVAVSVGEHKFQIRRMNRHYRVDRIILTTDTGFTPTGTGPAESPKL